MSNLRIQLDVQATIFRNCVIALLDSLGDPLSEGLFHDGVDHVDDEISRQSVDVTFFREVLGNLLVSLSEGENIFNTKPLVIRNVELLNVRVLDIYSFNQ